MLTLDATERKALTLTTFTAACICFAPAEIVSGILLLLASLALLRWDKAMLRRESALAVPAPTVAVGPQPVEPGAVEPGAAEPGASPE